MKQEKKKILPPTYFYICVLAGIGLHFLYPVYDFLDLPYNFLGLLPMITERSLQARFLIPMAISLAFGVMFATCITLVLVPSLYMILEDFKSIFFAGKRED